MNELIKVNYETEQPTVSARELHEKLNIDTKFTMWFERMCEYGFRERKDFFPKTGKSSSILLINFSTPYKKVRVQTEGKEK